MRGEKKTQQNNICILTNEAYQKEGNFSEFTTPLFSIFHFKVEPPSKENELRDLNNI